MLEVLGELGAGDDNKFFLSLLKYTQAEKTRQGGWGTGETRYVTCSQYHIFQY